MIVFARFHQHPDAYRVFTIFNSNHGASSPACQRQGARAPALALSSLLLLVQEKSLMSPQATPLVISLAFLQKSKTPLSILLLQILLGISLPALLSDLTEIP